MSNTLVFGFYGRSGQGVETAVKLFSKACFSSGFNVQSLCFTGRSRRVFPVRGYVKIDKDPIMSKQVEEPDFYLFFDPMLVAESKTLKEKSTAIFNSSEKIVSTQLKKRRVHARFVNATEIALLHLKSNTPNTAMLGALVKVFPKISMKSIKTVMEGMPRENMAAFDEGYKGVR